MLNGCADCIRQTATALACSLHTSQPEKGAYGGSATGTRAPTGMESGKEGKEGPKRTKRGDTVPLPPTGVLDVIPIDVLLKMVGTFLSNIDDTKAMRAVSRGFKSIVDDILKRPNAVLVVELTRTGHVPELLWTAAFSGYLVIPFVHSDAQALSLGLLPLRGLEILGVGPSVTSYGIYALARHGALTSLNLLQHPALLYNPEDPGEDTFSLDMIAQNPNLQSLSLTVAQSDVSGVSDVNTLAKLKHLKHLDLSNISFGEDGLESFRDHQSIESLTLSCDSFQQADHASVLPSITSLRTLRIVPADYTQNTSEILDHVSKCTGLTSIHLIGLGGDLDASVVQLCTDCINLEVLVLDVCKKLTNLCIPSIAALPKLKLLSMKGCTDITLDAMLHLDGHTSLERLFLDGISGTQEGVPVIIKGLPSLVEISANSIADCPGSSLAAAVLFLPTVRTARMHNYAWDRSAGDDNSALVVLGASPQLRVLETPVIWTTYTTTVSTVFLKKLVNVRSLRVSSMHALTATSDDVFLGILASMPSLRELDVGDMEHLTDDGIACIAANTSIEEFRVKGSTMVTDAGVRGFSEHPSLVRLYLDGCTGIGPSSVEVLSTCPKLQQLYAVNCTGLFGIRNAEDAYNAESPRAESYFEELRVLDISGSGDMTPDDIDIIKQHRGFKRLVSFSYTSSTTEKEGDVLPFMPVAYRPSASAKYPYIWTIDDGSL